MSAQTQIDRIKAAKTNIKAAIEGKGITVPNETKIDGMANLIAAIDTSEDLDEVLDEQESIIDAIQLALEGKAGSSGVSLDVITAASLPASVVDNQIVVITTTAASNIYVSTNEPSSPASGDIWVVVAEGEHILTLTEDSPYCELGLTKAAQYNGSAWTSCVGYLGKNGSWMQLEEALPPVGTSLEACTWEEIDRISQKGLAADYWAVGDQKKIVVDGTEYAVDIIGFDHDPLTASTIENAGITFCLHNCYNTQYAMNSTDTDAGGWGATLMRSTLQNTVFGKLPTQLQAVIKSVTKKSSIGSGSSTIESVSDTLFLLAEIEVFGTTANSKIGEGAQYPYFSTTESRQKTRAGSGANWWLRSPYTGIYTNRFCMVSTSGIMTSYTPKSAYDVCFAFCV